MTSGNSARNERDRKTHREKIAARLGVAVLAALLLVVSMPREGSSLSPAENSADLQASLASPQDAARVGADQVSDLCRNWSRIAAAEHGVPPRLMDAIAAVESGRPRAGQNSMRPWPWTVNAGGEGHWFSSAKAALDFVRSAQRNGETQIDIGCFQINLRWHGKAFNSLEQMVNPSQNARYAALFLKHLHGEFGDWTKAAAAFHSRTPGHGRAYLERLQAALGVLAPEVSPVALPPEMPNVDQHAEERRRTGGVVSLLSHRRAVSPLHGRQQTVQRLPPGAAAGDPQLPSRASAAGSLLFGGAD